MGKFHVLHVTHEIPLGGVAAKPGVEGLFFRHGCNGATGVVVGWVEQTRLRQRQQLLRDRGPEGVGIALLEITAAAAPHQQGISGEGHRLVIEHEADATVGVARGTAHLEGTAAKRNTIPVGQGQADVFSADDSGQTDLTAGGLVHQPASGHVVGMGVGIDRRHQLDAQLANQGEIAVVLLEDRIDDHSLAAGHIAQ